MEKFQAEWFELERILNSAAQREQAVDMRKNIDWYSIEQSLYGAAICAGCSIIEKAGRKRHNLHTINLFELRNAFVHNNSDISKNNNPKAHEIAIEYLLKQFYQSLPLNLPVAFYELNGSIVSFNNQLYMAVRGCLHNA